MLTKLFSFFGFKPPVPLPAQSLFEPHVCRLIRAANASIDDASEYNNIRIQFKTAYAEHILKQFPDVSVDCVAALDNNPARWIDLFEDMLNVHVHYDRIIRYAPSLFSDFSIASDQYFHLMKNLPTAGIVRMSKCVRAFMSRAVDDPEVRNAFLQHDVLFSMGCIFGEMDQIQSIIGHVQDPRGLMIRAVSTCSKTHTFLDQHQQSGNFLALLKYSLQKNLFTIQDIYAQTLLDQDKSFTTVFWQDTAFRSADIDYMYIFTPTLDQYFHATKVCTHNNDKDEILFRIHLQRELSPWWSSEVVDLLKTSPGFGLAMMHYGTSQTFHGMRNIAHRIFFDALPSNLDGALFYGLRINAMLDTQVLPEQDRKIIRILEMQRDLVGYTLNYDLEHIHAQCLEYQSYIEQIYGGHAIASNAEDLTFDV